MAKELPGVPVSGVAISEAPPQKPLKPLSVKPRVGAFATRVTSRYWVGLTRDCPVEQVAAGPITISQKTFASSPGPTGDYEYEQRAGVVMSLTNDDLKAVLESLETRGVEVARDEDGAVMTAAVVPLGPDIEPIAKYVFIAKLDDEDEGGNYWGRPTPKALYSDPT